MPKYCRVCFVCDKHASPTEFIGLHILPDREPAHSKWIAVLQLQPYDKLSSVRVCSRHFETKDFGGLVKSTYRLLPNAYPTLRMGDLASSITSGNDTPPSVIPDTPVPTETVQKSKPPPLVFLVDKPPESPAPSTPPTPPIALKSPSPSPVPVLKDIDAPAPSNAPGTHHVLGAPSSSSPSPPKRRCFEPRYVSEITTEDINSPKRASRVIAMVKERNALQTKKIQLLQCDIRKLTKKIFTMEQTIEDLKAKNSNPFTGKEDILALIPPVMREAVQRSHTGCRKFSPELRTFAHKLYFHSPKAYNYIREVWEDLLPHPKTVESWDRCILFDT